MKNQWFYKVSIALMVVMLAVAVLPITSAYAAACSWDGSASTAWATGANWTGCTGVGGVPAAIDTITIPNVANKPILGANVTIGGLTVDAGSSLTLGTSQLTINGPVSNAGTITASTGRIMQQGIGDFTNSGTVTFTGAGRIYFTGNMTNTGTMTLNASEVRFYGADAGPFTVAGFTTTGPIDWRRTAGTVTFAGNVTAAQLLMNNGGIGGTLNLGSGLSHTINGVVTLGGGATLNGGSSTLALTGAWTGAGFTASTGTINYSGAAQTVAAFAYNNLIFSGSGVKTIPAGTSITGNLSIRPSGTATATIAAGQNISVGTLSLAGTGQVNGTWGGTTSGAAHIDTGFFNTSTGFLTVTTSAGLLTPTLSVTNSPVTYNGASQTATVTCSSGGAVSNILYAASPTAPTNAGTYAVTANCAAVAGYTALTNASAGNFVISPATPTATITNTPIVYNGAVRTATVACSGGGAATLATGGTGTNAGSYPATVNCAASANYTLANGLVPTNGAFVISPATPTATITNTPIVYNGAVRTATVACSGGGAATLATGGTGTNAGSYPATVNCAASANYTLANGLVPTNGAFVISPATPTATITNTPIVYNGAVRTATVACSGGGAATLATGGTGTNAGSYPATVNCAASANYTLANGLVPTNGAFVISPATPTATITNTPIVYNGAVRTATVACSGGGAATLATGGTGTNAGSYPATVNCAASANYTLANGLVPTNGAFVISPATPTATITNTPIVYNGAVRTATVACSGGGAATLATGGTGTNAGSYPATVNCAASANYTLANGLVPTNGAFVISPATPTATITNTPVVYNGAVQTATVACSGGGAATLATGGTGTNIGSYPATVNCAASANYTLANGLVPTNGAFVINPIAPTVTVTNGPVDYDGLTHAATVSCLGGGAASNILTGGATTQTNAGTYIVTADCAANGNYGAATGVTAGNSFVINRITPTASVSNTPQNYNGAAQSATVSCLGGGAVSNILTGGAATQTNAGTYAVTVDCAVSTNYNAAVGVAAGNFVINKIAPTASVTNTPQNYTGLAQSATVACLGGGVASNILTGGAATQTNTGTYPVTVDCATSTNYSAATGLSAGNFVIDIVGQTINVTTSAPLTASNGSTFDVIANATSSLFVTITSAGSCTGGDTDGTATITMTSGTGTCVVSYNQAGDTNYSAAAQIQQSVTATEGPSFTSLNSTSFDMGFLGSFPVTATGNPLTMTISEAGALPSGVSFVDNGDGTALLAGTPAAGTNGTYPLVFTANNGVAPNGTQNFTLIVKNGPTVSANGINSVPDTGDANVSENESILDTLGITTLTVQFSQDVYDDPTDALDYGHDVTNPANYILVRSTDGTYATVDCKGGVLPPDVAISVDSVTYSNGGGSGPYVATLSINGGFPLNVVGFYRLYVCGTTSIVDANNRGLELAGNGTTPGTDFQRNFRVATVVAGGGGGGGGSSSSKTAITSSFLIPVTGFAPNQVTTLPAQPADINYTSMGQMTIEIPALGIKYPIVGASITNRTWDLTWLKDSVAYLEGSAYPTTAGNTVLTAHVQDANKNLGPFSDIKGMELGQKVYIHVNGQIYVYQVQENRKISASNITEMFKHEEDSWLTLVTCEDFNAKTGLYTSRRMVRAVLISVIFEK